MGNSIQFLDDATSLISLHLGDIIRSSSYYQTAAWGLENQPDFINQVLLVHTPFSPVTALQKCLYIEKLLGRYRSQKWGPRTIDIDVLFYENSQIQISNLQIPHPFIQERNFVLQPLAEILPNWKHPKLLKTCSQLAKLSADPLPTQKLNLIAL